MATDNKNLTKADLLTLVGELEDKLANAQAGDGGRVEELTKQLSVASAETAAARNRAEELIAQLAEANAERGKLAALLEAAHQAHPSAASVTAKPTEVNGPAIVVRTRQGREQARYRIGRAFTREDTIIALADLSDDQLEALKSDRELVVSDHVPD
ncbi:MULTISPECIES: hypothetical protein [unclassified Bradyrhizobium]|uniref:hypothetical protein n=1 Tax=unclassified Bradyrhizobium TaxID=2631580 RepID=UPI00211EC97F|nr:MULTISPECIES: hypothetical protein [unclassified Bradyrhizobium]MDD1534567.1 hypothetical protein [Bradyrhizobium sp. WBOS8]MDD1581431.1 hypothetical protein [Bradyrhizobium sp. WBOS4]UUO49720.1 hypothetical protein DCM78_24100 [Bradyrhizobium sp. WBOS04]UUO58485.1 hypothetical protein DCM80_04375 [Bradyrhizobium sp. WBOS08]